MAIPLETTRFIAWNNEVRPSVDDVTAAVVDEGFIATLLADPPNADYDWHEHDTAQLLVVVSGSMTVRTAALTHDMHPGDRLYLAPNERHAATVGVDGVEYFDITRTQ